MKITSPRHFTFPLVMALTGSFMAASLAVAQDVTEEIVVRSPIERTDARIPIGSSVTTRTIELNQYVAVSDLDLTKPEDVEKLDERITAIAKESCEKLAKMFPLDRSDLTEVNRCMKKAIASANEQKEKAIAAGP